VKLAPRHQKTLAAVFEDPMRASVAWTDVEHLLLALEADLSQGRGARVRVALHGVRAVFHRPHPRNEIDRGALRSLRRFLTTAGVDVEDGDA
jgi:HicA toxin of bacterial toxin-antitoxin,